MTWIVEGFRRKCLKNQIFSFIKRGITIKGMIKHNKHILIIIKCLYTTSLVIRINHIDQ